MHGSTFDPLLVSLSFLVVVVASYTALELSKRVASSRGATATLWLITGSVSMGIGMWAMHFVGMLALQTEVPFTYSVPFTMLSLVISIGVSAFAIYVGSRSSLTKWARLSSGLILGTGIAGMHYAGMEAMEAQATLVYDWLLVWASVAIVVVSATSAIFVVLTVADSKNKKLFRYKFVAAVILGVGIFGMHYTGMMAASFIPKEGVVVDQETARTHLRDNFMAVMLAIGALIVLGVTHLTIFFDRLVNIQKRIGEKATKESLRLASILDDSINEIFVVDPVTFKFLNVNKGAINNLGYSREQLLTMGPYDINPTLKKGGNETIESALRASPTKSIEIESLHQRANGETYPVQSTLQLSEAAGAPVIIAVVSDITERKNLQSQVAQSKKLESIGQLAAGIAHEINTPAQFVGDNVQFLQDAFGDLLTLTKAYKSFFEKNRAGSLCENDTIDIEKTIQTTDAEFLLKEVPDAIEQSLDGVHRISKIVLAMKEFSHPGCAEKELVDLGKNITNTITVASNEWKYVAEMQTDFSSDLPLVKCYPQKISQVILNLIVNAAHSIMDKNANTPEKLGTIFISTRKYGDIAEIRVTDSGCGVPSEIRSQIFDPFFTTKEVGIGTGQGLAMAYSTIVDKHQGKLIIDSKINEGTTFIIQIPINPKAIRQEAEAA